MNQFNFWFRYEEQPRKKFVTKYQQIIKTSSPGIPVLK